VATSPTTQDTGLREFQRNDVVRDASRPNQPPSKVLEVSGPTVKLRVEGADGSKRVVKAKAADLESVQGHEAPHGEAASSPLPEPTVQEQAGRTTPAVTAPRFARPSGALPSEVPATHHAPVTVAAPERGLPASGENSVSLSKLLHPSDRVLVRSGGKVSTARVVEAVGNTVKVVPDGQAPRAGSAVRVKRSDVEVVPPSGEGTPHVATLSPPSAKLPSGGAQSNAAPASSTPEAGPVGDLAEWVVLPGGGSVQRETVEAAADLLALRTKQQELSGYRTRWALKETIRTNDFGEAVKLLKGREGHAAAEAVLNRRRSEQARSRTDEATHHQ